MIPGRHHRSELRIHLVWGAFWISVYLGLVLAPLFALLVACRACHSIEGEGNTRSLLDGVGSRLTEKEIRLWIVAPQQTSGPSLRETYLTNPGSNPDPASG